MTTVTYLAPLSQGTVQPSMITPSGIVVADEFVLDVGYEAFRYQNGTLTTLSGFGLISPNNSWQAGSETVGDQEQAALKHNGVVTLLGAGYPPDLTGINDNGDVIGLETVGNGTEVAFYQPHGGQVVELAAAGALSASPNSLSSFATGINDSGQVVGWGTLPGDQSSHAFLYQNGVMTDLGVLPGGFQSSAAAINQAGQIVGDSNTTDARDAVLWQNGAMIDLGGLPGGDNAGASGINDQGQIVGSGSDDGGRQHAILWENGVAIDLNNLLPTNSGWVLTSATGIDDQGDILGTGTYNGTTTAFLLTLGSGAAHSAVQFFNTGLATTTMPVADTAFDIVNDLSGLEKIAKAGLLGSITLTDGGTPTITLTSQQLTADADVLKAIKSPYQLMISIADNQTIAGIAGHTNTATLNQFLFNSRLSIDANGVLTIKDLVTGGVDKLTNVSEVEFKDQNAYVTPGGAIVTTKLLYGTPFAISSNGDIAETSTSSDLDFQQARIGHGFFTADVPYPDDPANGSGAFDINAQDDIAGYVRTVQNGATTTMATLWHWYNFASTSTSLGMLPGDISSIATGVNNSDLVTGVSISASGATHGFLWKSGSMSDLGSLGGGEVDPLHINDQGVIVGNATTAGGAEHAFLSQGGTMQDLGTLAGGSSSSATDINDKGTVVGYSFDSSGHQQAVLWQNGAISKLALLSGTVAGSAVSINNLGIVTGACVKADGTTVAVVWMNGAPIDLNTLLPATSGWTLTSAEAINDEGQIAGDAVYNGNACSFSMNLAAILPTASSLPTLISNFQLGYLSAPQNVSDSAANIQGNLGILEQVFQAGLLGSITLTDTGLTVSGQQYSDDAGVFQHIAGSYALTVTGITAAAAANTAVDPNVASMTISDTSSAVSANLDALEGLAVKGKIASIATTDTGLLLVTASQSTADAKALSLIDSYALGVSQATVAQAITLGSQAHVTTILVSDSGAHISSALDTLESLAASAKLTGITFTDPGFATVTVTPDQLTSDAGALKVMSGNFNIAIRAGANQSISGVAGHATVADFTGSASQYTITTQGNGDITVSGASGVNHLSGVTALQFADDTDFIASTTPPAGGTVSSAEVANLYAAVFARTPDAAGLAYYQAQAVATPNLGITDFAKWFLTSPEYTGNSAHDYAPTSFGDTQFITDTYTNLLHRAPAAGDVAWYRANVINPILQSGGPTTQDYLNAELQAHAAVLADFSQSSEFFSDVTVTAQTPSNAQHWLILA